MAHVAMEDVNNSRLICISDNISDSMSSSRSKESTMFVCRQSDEVHTEPSPAGTSLERMSDTEKKSESPMLVTSGRIFLEPTLLIDSPERVDSIHFDSGDDGGLSNSLARSGPVAVEERRGGGGEDEGRKKVVARQMLKCKYQGVHFKEYANFLGAAENRGVLVEFVALLQPLPESLVLALRKLSTAVYFIAEAGAIDAILEEVSVQWIHRHNPEHYQGNFRLAHIVLFSLLILNSDLYNDMAQEKFTCVQFVDNTIYALLKESPTIDKQRFEAEMRGYYEMLSVDQLPLYRLPTAEKGLRPRASRRVPKFNSKLERTFSNASTYSVNVMSRQLSSATKHGSSGLTNWRYHHNKELPGLYLKEPLDMEMNLRNGSSWLMDYVIQFQELYSPATKDAATTMSMVAPVQQKRRLLGWFKKDNPQSIFKTNEDLTSEDRKWLNARVRISEGRLYVFNFKNAKALDPAIADLEACRKKASSYTVHNLVGATATFVQDNIVHNSNHATWNFKIAFPKTIDCEHEKVYRFQTTEMELAQQFVQAASFWSARITPLPSAQFEMVSNQEYGWSEDILSGEVDPFDVSLSLWTPLIGIDSIYEDIDQPGHLPLRTKLYHLKVFTDQLSELIDDHNFQKPQMVSIWSQKGTTKMFEMAMDNWNHRYLYLNTIYEKHYTYLKALEAACNGIDEDTSR